MTGPDADDSGLERPATERTALSRELSEFLIEFSIAHDLGKTRVPLALLNKRGKLTDQEHRVMRQHPVDGARIIGGALRHGV